MEINRVVELIEKRLKYCKTNKRGVYSLAYQSALNDLIGDITKEINGKMIQLGERNFLLINQGVKMLGTYNPDEILCIFEEELYVNEVYTIRDFLTWVHNGKEIEKYGTMCNERSFGRGNYEERFQEFLNTKN